MIENYPGSPPIFEQIYQHLGEEIITGVLLEESPVTSIRQMALDLSVNPLTVSKAYQKAEEAGWIKKERGIGFKVMSGAKEKAYVSMRSHFLDQEWPRISRRLEFLGFSVESLKPGFVLSNE